MSGVGTEELRGWIGRSEVKTDVIDPWRAGALAAVLDQEFAPAEGDPLPPAWHWSYFLASHRTSELGYDGHARLGGFLPPVPLPRRMWAGGRLSFEGVLRIGETAQRTSTIADVALKEGRSGKLAFVLVRHEITGAGGGRVLEEHDIVYREPPAPGSTPPVTPRPVLPAAEWSRQVVPDPVLLFRYSALTFNGHRIHYDREFCRREGYPGLVVHGPLTATLLLDLVSRSVPGRAVKRFEFRAVSSLFDTEPYTLNCGRAHGRLIAWAENARGELAVRAEVELES